MQSLPIDCSLCQWTGILKNYQVTFSIVILCTCILFLFLYKEHLDQFHPNHDGQCLSNESFQDQNTVQLSVQESHSFLEGVKHNQDIINQDLSSLKEKVNDMQYVSYDGTFVWKITNFKEKMSK
jgi:hypothetical protein